MTEEKKDEIKKEPGNGHRDDFVKEPISVTVQMQLLLDKAKIRQMKSKQDVICYLLDTILTYSNQFEGLAIDLRKEALGTPKLIIPTGSLNKLLS